MSKILICTGIYPPQIGGPAQYAKEVGRTFRDQGHTVRVLTYGLERKLPQIIRHKFILWRASIAIVTMGLKGLNRHSDKNTDKSADFILALDTLSVGWPSVVAAKIWRKKILIRTGGDFLWESYVERTGDLVLFKNFYETCRDKLNFKERMIFNITKWTLQNADAVIFSTEWQRDIFTKFYNLDSHKNFIVENFYGSKIGNWAQKLDSDSHKNQAQKLGKKIFVAGTRQLKWKNIDRLKQAFSIVKNNIAEIDINLSTYAYEKFLDKIKNSYAVILVSLGDISPNMILDAIRAGRPFILTRENGLTPRIKDIAIFCNPEDPKDIAEKILWLSDEKNYSEQKKKIFDFNFTHSWQEIVKEITDVVGKL